MEEREGTGWEGHGSDPCECALIPVGVIKAQVILHNKVGKGEDHGFGWLPVLTSAVLLLPSALQDTQAPLEFVLVHFPAISKSRPLGCEWQCLSNFAFPVSHKLRPMLYDCSSQNTLHSTLPLASFVETERPDKIGVEGEFC